MDKVNKIKAILKIEPEYQTSFIGCQYAIFKNITHRKAINQLLKNGFKYSLNGLYIINNNIIIKKSPLNGFSNVLMVEVVI